MFVGMFRVQKVASTEVKSTFQKLSCYVVISERVFVFVLTDFTVPVLSSACARAALNFNSFFTAGYNS